MSSRPASSTHDIRSGEAHPSSPLSPFQSSVVTFSGPSPWEPAYPIQPEPTATLESNAYPLTDMQRFPRSNWSLGFFRSPPFFPDDPADFVDRAHWAACNASKAWQKAMDDGDQSALQSHMLFKLAVLDKILELNEIHRKDKQNGVRGIPMYATLWFAELEDIQEQAYEMGINALPPAARREAPQLSSMAPLYRNILARSLRFGLDAMDVVPGVERMADASVFGDFDPMQGKYEWTLPYTPIIPLDILLRNTGPTMHFDDDRSDCRAAREETSSKGEFKHLSELVREAREGRSTICRFG